MTLYPDSLIFTMKPIEDAFYFHSEDVHCNLKYVLQLYVPYCGSHERAGHGVTQANVALRGTLL